MKLKILGSGCTWGTPKPGCKCRTCRTALEKGVPFSRDRFGLLLNDDVMVDAGPDLRQQLLREGIGLEGVEALLLTHAHYDHYCGLGEFRGVKKPEPVKVYGLKETFDVAFSKSCFRYLADLGFLELNEVKHYEGFRVGELEVTPIELSHGSELSRSFPIAGFVIKENKKKLVIASDSNADIPAKSKELMKGADLLVLDAWTQNEEEARKAARNVWGLSQSEEEFNKRFKVNELSHLLLPGAKALAEELKARKTVVLHFTHTTLPHDELEKKWNTPSFAIGFDGMELEAFMD